MLDEVGRGGRAGDVAGALARRRELVRRHVLVAALRDVAQRLRERLQADARAAGARVPKVGEPRQALAPADAVAQLRVPGQGGGGQEGEEGCGVHFFFGLGWIGW